MQAREGGDETRANSGVACILGGFFLVVRELQFCGTFTFLFALARNGSNRPKLRMARWQPGRGYEGQIDRREKAGAKEKNDTTRT